jgi:hypothetical protein
MTPQELEVTANAAGWKRMPVAGDPNITKLVFTRGASMIQVRVKDERWAFYTEVTGGNQPDKWGKDFAGRLL